VNGAASMGIPIGEQLGPSVQPAVGAESIQVREVSIAQRQVVEPGPQPIMTRITNVGRLLQDQVHTRLVAPDAALRPVGIGLVLPTELGEQPMERIDHTGQVVGPQIDAYRDSTALSAANSGRSGCSGHDEEPRLEATGNAVDRHCGPAGLCEHVTQ